MRLYFPVLMFAGLVSMTNASQPPRFNYQARLTDSNSIPIQGSHTLYFGIYQGGGAEVANGGDLVYSESATLTISGGVANHSVGSGSTPSPGPLSAAMFRTDQDLYLQVAVDSPVNVVLPRTRLESVPFAIVSADADARTPLAQPTTFPIVLSTPGSYYLTTNLQGLPATDGIQITTSGVALDLTGFALSGAGTGNGIFISSQVKYGKIYNGSLTGWGTAVSGATAKGITAHDLQAVFNSQGITLGDQSIVADCLSMNNSSASSSGVTAVRVGNDSVVRRCVCSSNSSSANAVTGIQSGSGVVIEDCTCNGNSCSTFFSCFGINCGAKCRVLNCVCSENLSTGSLGGTVAGIAVSSSCEVSGNICEHNRATVSGSFAFGLVTGSGCYIHNNLCGSNSSVGSGRSIGIEVEDKCRVECNHCREHSGTTNNNFGLVVFSNSTGCTIIKNTTTNNVSGGLKFENTSGSNYYAENVFDETTSVSQAVGGANVAGTGDRSNVLF